jgi:hypothetical protein
MADPIVYVAELVEYQRAIGAASFTVMLTLAVVLPPEFVAVTV